MDRKTYLEIRNGFQEPYTLTVASMSISEIGREAEDLERASKKMFANKKQIVDKMRSMLSGIMLRTTRNLLAILDEDSRISTAKRLGINVKDLDEYYFSDIASSSINLLLFKRTGVYLDEHVKKGFMITVMELIDIGNTLLTATEERLLNK
ncbi:MAG: hypothetical protein WCO19_03825 [Candidatus Saccharibacteria bacterium]